MASTTFLVATGARVACPYSGTTTFAVATGSYAQTRTGLAVTNASRSERWLPPVRQPFGHINLRAGQTIGGVTLKESARIPVEIDAVWYRFFDELAERRLGGVNGPTVSEIGTTAQSAVSTASQASEVAVIAQQQSIANTSSLEQAKEVLVAGNVPNATYISVARREDLPF